MNLNGRPSNNGVDSRRELREVHVDIDAANLEIRAIDVILFCVCNAQALPDLLPQPPFFFEKPFSSVCGRFSYGTKFVNLLLLKELHGCHFCSQEG